jgi:hypothetical protein
MRPWELLGGAALYRCDLGRPMDAPGTPQIAPLRCVGSLRTNQPIAASAMCGLGIAGHPWNAELGGRQPGLKFSKCNRQITTVRAAFSMYTLLEGFAR